MSDLKPKELKLNQLRKKNSHVGVRISEEERKALETFCQRENISITAFIRYSIRKVLNDKKLLK